MHAVLMFLDSQAAESSAADDPDQPDVECPSVRRDWVNICICLLSLALLSGGPSEWYLVRLIDFFLIFGG